MERAARSGYSVRIVTGAQGDAGSISVSDQSGGYFSVNFTHPWSDVYSETTVAGTGAPRA